MSPEAKTKIKKIYNIFSTVVIAVVFVFFVFVIIFSMVQKNQGKDVKIFGHYMYTILTDSMVPTLNPSDVIWSKAATEEDIVEGAIITFVVPEGNGGISGMNDTHRIVEVERDENGNITAIYTKGDNASSRDPWTLTVGDVKAVMSKKLVVISALVGFISEYRFLAYVVLIVLPLSAIAIAYAIGFINEKVKEKREEEKKNIGIEDLTDEEKKKMLEDYLAGMSDDATADGKKEDNNGEECDIKEENPVRNPENEDEQEKTDADEISAAKSGDENAD